MMKYLIEATLFQIKTSKTGFKFLYNIKQSIEEMITKWKFTKKQMI